MPPPAWSIAPARPALLVAGRRGQGNRRSRENSGETVFQSTRSLKRRVVYASASGGDDDATIKSAAGDKFLSVAEYRALLQGIESETEVTAARLAVTSNDVMGVSSRTTMAQKEVRERWDERECTIPVYQSDLVSLSTHFADSQLGGGAKTKQKMRDLLDKAEVTPAAASRHRKATGEAGLKS